MGVSNPQRHPGPLGTPFSDDNRQQMAATGTFLELDFDFSSAMAEGTIFFFVRERLVRKVQDMAQNIVDSRLFKYGVASKLYGLSLACSVASHQRPTVPMRAGPHPGASCQS